MGRPRPLLKNTLFLGLLLFTSVYMVFSMLIFSRMDDDVQRDDDPALRGGPDDLQRIYRSRKHKKLHHHHHTEPAALEEEEEQQQEEEETEKEKPADLAELYLDDEPQSAIAKFRADQEKDRKSRQRKGIVTQREHFEQEKFDPDDWERIQQSMQKIRKPNIPTQDLPYDIYNCPHDPPPNYPFAWNIMDVLDNWNPEDMELPQSYHQGICVFDWDREGDDEKAENYRQKEVPFVMANYPETLRAAERWTTPGYLEALLGKESNTNEHSKGNHFMYWRTKSPRADYDPPTDTAEMTFAEWYEKAQEVKEAGEQKDMDHWYYRLNAMLHNHAYLYEELPFFDPTLGRTLTMVTPDEHRGINCRFGMKGTIAESHYDSHNNFIAVMGGQRRYILAHPDQCINMELYPRGHPSARHSRIDFGKAYFLWRDSDRPFVSTQVNEILMQPGDIMYLPTYWFHYIVSLNTTYQCNSRSGDSKIYQRHIDECGFGK